MWLGNENSYLGWCFDFDGQFYELKLNREHQTLTFPPFRRCCNSMGIKTAWFHFYTRSLITGHGRICKSRNRFWFHLVLHKKCESMFVSSAKKVRVNLHLEARIVLSIMKKWMDQPTQCKKGLKLSSIACIMFRYLSQRR